MKEKSNFVSHAMSGMKLLIASVVKTSGIFYYSTVSDISGPLASSSPYAGVGNHGQRLKSAVIGPVIRYLGDNIRQLGGDLHNHNIYCRRCSNRRAGGFDPEYGILICANEMKDQGHLEDTLGHEMVHAYDHLRFKVDWANNLRHAACTEVVIIRHISGWT